MEFDAKSKNSNYQRIDKMILTAFLNLSGQKSYNQITVTELCAEANVNRTTFYKHYRGTWEIKEHISDELVDVVKTIMTQFKDKDVIANSLDIFKAINYELESKLDFYISLHRMKESNLFVDKIIDAVRENLVNHLSLLEGEFDIHTIQIAFTYFTGGIVGTYKGWFNGRVACSLDEVAETLSQFVKNSFIKI